MIQRELSQKGTSTKAQEAMRALHESKKLGRKELRKETREAEKEHKFLLKQEKKKEKHKGH
jgi:hypothetical protein